MSSYDDIFYTVADGLTLYARDYAGPTDDAPVLLCMHGLTRNSRDFERIAPRLAQTHRVIVPEQRGRGRSDYDTQPERYTPPTYIGDMFTLLMHLQVTRCATIGTSMGGLMAMGMNAANPALFTHVVLNDIGPIVAEAGLSRIKGYVGSGGEFANWDDATEYARRINESAFPDYDDAQWRTFAAQLCTEKDGKVVLDYDLAISAPIETDESNAVPPDLWPLFDALAKKPLMLVRGMLTDILDEQCTNEMQRRHPDMIRVDVANVGHAPMLDEAGVLDQIVAFINDQ